MNLHNAHLVEHLQGAIGWFDYHLEADHWSALGDVAPTDAAMLLCRFNPNNESYAEACRTTTDELSPEHLVRLVQRLADISKADPRQRTLRDWHQTVRKNGLAYHSWIDGYMEATAESTAPQDATPSPAAWVERGSSGESTEQRQARRYKACEAAGLTMPSDDYAHLPRGIGSLARAEGITRQAFAEDVKAHIRRLNGR